MQASCAGEEPLLKDILDSFDMPHKNTAIDQIIARMLSQFVDAHGDCPRDNARRMHAMLSPEDLYSEATAVTVPIGTLCSGSDLISPVCRLRWP